MTSDEFFGADSVRRGQHEQARYPVIGITTDPDEVCLRVKHGYCEAIVAAGGAPVLLPPSGTSVTYALMIDGLLIPGGDDVDPHYYHEDMGPAVKPVSRLRSEFEFALLDEVMRHQKPVLGICYGMQLINVFLGGTLHQDIGIWAKNHRRSSHAVEVMENGFLKKGKYSVNSTHHEAVKALGEGLSVLALSPDGLIEAFCKEAYNFFIGVQWHPERLRDDELSLSLFSSFIRAASDNK